VRRPRYQTWRFKFVDVCLPDIGRDNGPTIHRRYRVRRFRNVRTALALLTSLFAAIGFAAAAAPAASVVLGDWQGTLDTGNGSLRVVLHLAQDQDGKLTGTMDSLDQGAMGIPISSVTYTQPDVRFSLEKFGSTYEGKLDKDKHQIVGVWKQGSASLPLTLGRTGK
jgi:uncharacterized protein